MPERTQIDMPVLEERVRAAARMVPEKETKWRRLATRTRTQFNPRSGWMIRLLDGDSERYAVELVPCDAGDPGAVSLQRDRLPEQIHLDTQVLYDLWEEEWPSELGAEPPPEMLGEALPREAIASDAMESRDGLVRLVPLRQTKDRARAKRGARKTHSKKHAAARSSRRTRKVGSSASSTGKRPRRAKARATARRAGRKRTTARPKPASRRHSTSRSKARAAASPSKKTTSTRKPMSKRSASSTKKRSPR